MKVKSGVELNGVHFLLWYAAALYDAIRQSYSLGEGTITSGRDGGDAFGPARVANSQHPAGLAVDLRSTDLPGGPQGEYADAVARLLQQALGQAFYVLREEDHIHVELRRGANLST